MKKTVIITGAAGNLGRSVTSKFLDEGFRVQATLGPDDRPDFMQHEFLHTQRLDLLEEEAVSEYVNEWNTAEGQIAGAVMLVGGFAMGDIHGTDLAALEHMYKLNFETAYNLSRPLIRKLQEQGRGGRLVFTGSRPAFTPEEGKGLLAYSLSKSLLFSLADLLNASFAKEGITSAVIVPGTMDTRTNRESMPDADFKKWVSTDKVADAIHYLFTDSGLMLREPVLMVYNQS